jgi:virulence factor
MQKIKVAVIGVGHAGRDYHLPGLSKFPDVDLSICDINAELLAQAGDAGKIPPERRYTDYRKMLETENPQAVLVLMAQYPHGQYRPDIYFQIVNEVLDQRRAVLVEKPLAMTLAEAQPLAEKAQRQGCITMVSVNRRFNPLVTFCLNVVRRQGPVSHVVCQYYKAFAGMNSKALAPLQSEMIHAVDLMRFLAGGEVAACHAASGRAADDGQTTAYHALVSFDNQVTGMFSGNVRAGERLQLWQIHGPGISAVIETDLDSALCDKKMRAVIYRPGEKPAVYLDREMPTGRSYLDSAEFVVFNGFAYADRYFINCVRSGQEPHCNFSDACKTLALCDQIAKYQELIKS